MFEASFRVLIPVLVVSGAILITVFDGSEASLKNQNRNFLLFVAGML